MAVHTNTRGVGHERYYDEARKEAYIIYEMNGGKIYMGKQHIAKPKAIGKRNGIRPYSNPDHSIMP
jgi:hypothetical protein